MNLSKMKIVFLSCLAFFILACSKGKIDDFSEGEETSAVSFALKTDYTSHPEQCALAYNRQRFHF